MAWVGKSPHAICEQMKDPARNGRRSLAAHDWRVVADMSIPCAGVSPLGWQLAQRGWRKTRLASRNRARERSPRSAIDENEATARNARGSSAGAFASSVSGFPDAHAAISSRKTRTGRTVPRAPPKSMCSCFFRC